MKERDEFSATIEEYLQAKAGKDERFAKKMANPKKSIADCVTYILNTVRETKRTGFADEEIYGMAVHYYDESSVEVGERQTCRIVTNKSDKADGTPTNAISDRASAPRKMAKQEVSSTNLFDYE